jgi:hypothetical protein
VWSGVALGVSSFQHYTETRNQFRLTYAVADPTITRAPYQRKSQLLDMTFDDFIADGLQGAIPGSYMYTRPRNSVSRESCRSAFNQRARQGFRYWLIERPKPTSCKYNVNILHTFNEPNTMGTKHRMPQNSF